MPVEVECPNPECRFKMQFESAPIGEVACPACGTTFQVEEPEGEAGAEEVQSEVGVEEKSRLGAETMNFEIASGVCPSAELEEAEVEGGEEGEEGEDVLESAEASEPGGHEEGEPLVAADHPIAGHEGHEAPPVATAEAVESRVVRKRELPPILIVSVISCSLLVFLIIAKWYVQTGRFWGTVEEARRGPGAEQAQTEEEMPESVDGWGTEEEIARQVAAKVSDWEKAKPGVPGVEFVAVKRDGTANFTTLREAFAAVGNGGLVEIQDNGIYDEDMMGYGQKGESDKGRILRKHNITLRTAAGHMAAIRWPPVKKAEGNINFLLCVGADWRISNLIFVGDESLKTTAIYAPSGGIYIRGCHFMRVKHAVVRTGKYGETEFRNCVFDENTAYVAMLQEGEEIPKAVFHNNVVKNAKAVFALHPSSSAEAVLKSAAFSILNNIFINVDGLLVGTNLPKKVEIMSEYNCFWNPLADKQPPREPEQDNLLGKYLAKLQKSKKCDANSLSADPLADKKYRLAENSPCRGRGKDGVDMGVLWDRVQSEFEEESSSETAPPENGMEGETDHTRVYEVDR